MPRSIFPSITKHPNSVSQESRCMKLGIHSQRLAWQSDNSSMIRMQISRRSFSMLISCILPFVVTDPNSVSQECPPSIPQSSPLQHMETVGASVPVDTPVNPNSPSGELSHNPMTNPPTVKPTNPLFMWWTRFQTMGWVFEHTEQPSLVYLWWAEE